MPFLYSRAFGASSGKTLFVNEYLTALDSGTLTPDIAALGFKTYVARNTDIPVFTTESEYLNQFRQRLPLFHLLTIMAFRPSLQVNGLPSVSEDSPTTTPTSDRNAAKMNMLKRMRPPPFKYAWTFYHDKHSDSTNYEGRLTILLENIITLKPFWEAFNNYPVEQLKMKDSLHFFKRGVRPVWEDPRNVNGGALVFRVTKAHTKEFWKEILMMAVGDQFADVVQPKDDICGISLNIRMHTNLVSIWTRDGSNEKSWRGILGVVFEQLSPELKPKEENIFKPYYKMHSQHAGFSEVVTVAKKAEEAKKVEEAKVDAGKIEEAKVKEDEAQAALEKEVEDEEAEKREQEFVK
ncbi:hypothetical protein MMC20_006961 [Loxospora ochrophaea]|nr:hypothetical protein [Loxospora ochrophaea]